jgi:stringent starvation protein B
MSICQVSTKPKYEAVNRFLLDEYVLIHLDPSRPGVVVPAHLAKGEVLTLKLSKLFRGAMELTREKVTADLLFDQDYFSCVVPLDAIWGATSEKGETVVWPESAPPNVLKGIPENKRATAAAIATAAAPAPEAAPEAASDEQAPLKKKGHLTRVK